MCCLPGNVPGVTYRRRLAGSFDVSEASRQVNHEFSLGIAVQTRTMSPKEPAISPFGEMRTRGHLPHWEEADGIYFVTFRLGDSLPKAALQEVRLEKEAILARARQAGRGLTEAEERQLRRLETRHIEKWLDRGSGACWMRDPRVAAVVASALAHFDGERYRLLAWCVMPNHVHVVFRPVPGNKLAEIVHSWKSFSAKSIGRMLDRRGEFWMREYYDHLVRNSKQLTRIIRYVAENPARAGLKDWKWVGIASDWTR